MVIAMCVVVVVFGAAFALFRRTQSAQSRLGRGMKIALVMCVPIPLVHVAVVATGGLPRVSAWILILGAGFFISGAIALLVAPIALQRLVTMPTLRTLPNILLTAASGAVAIAFASMIIYVLVA
ncbi:MAG: hypothetical protein ABSE43_03025 [Steroidobacteraceae bacterium]|jgi:hypothetical protein